MKIPKKGKRFPKGVEKGIQTEENEKEKNKASKWKITIPVINIKKLWQEWKSRKKDKESQIVDLNSKATQTKYSRKKQLKDLVKSKQFLAVITSLAYVGFSIYDNVTDGILAQSFLEGTHYNYVVDHTLEGRNF